MARADALHPYKLIPVVSFASCIHRISANSPSDSKFKPDCGTFFVGLNTFIQTGLPFHLNAPIFLHELKGSVIFNSDDDSEFRAQFPLTRTVKIGIETKSVWLHVWNR